MPWCEVVVAGGMWLAVEFELAYFKIPDSSLTTRNGIKLHKLSLCAP